MAKSKSENRQTLATVNITAFAGADNGGEAKVQARIATNKACTPPSWSVVKKIVDKTVTVSEVENMSPMEATADIQFYDKSVKTTQVDNGGTEPSEEAYSQSAGSKDPLLTEKLREQDENLRSVQKDVRQHNWWLWVMVFLLGAIGVFATYAFLKLVL